MILSEKYSKFKFYFDAISTLHGVAQLRISSTSHRISWILILLGNGLLTAYLLIVIKNRFEANELYTRVDSTCVTRQVPFPSVAICNANMVSLKNTHIVRQILLDSGKSNAEVDLFLASLFELHSLSYNSTTDKIFQNNFSVLKKHLYDINNLMAEVHQSCEDLVLHCRFDGKEKNCRDVIKLIQTYEGFCCAFNYGALNDEDVVPFLNEDPDLEYYDDREIGKIISTSGSGRESGLSLIINVEPDDYPSWSTAPYYGAKIIISDPNDYPEETIMYRYIETGQALEINTEALIYISDQNIGKVPPKHRNCFFHQEVKLEHTDRYSFETCQSECRMMDLIHTCHCLPFQYPKKDGVRLCEYSDIPCLFSVKVYPRSSSCQCLPECDDKRFFITSNTMPFGGQDYTLNVTKNMNLTQVSSLKVFFGKSTCNCYKKALVMDSNKLIATYGGVFSLSVGGSLLTIFEITYLLYSYLMVKLIRLYKRFIINQY